MNRTKSPGLRVLYAWLVLVAVLLIGIRVSRGQMAATGGCVTITSERDQVCEIEVWGERPVITAGSNTVLLADVPEPGTVRIYRNGLRMAVVSDYKQVGRAITFVVPLVADDALVADYRY
jgi:hypothetical protein